MSAESKQNSTTLSNNSTGLDVWTESELDETLYQWDNDTDPVLEFRYSTSIKRAIALHPVEAPTKSPYDGSKIDNQTEEELYTSFLDIPIKGDDVHIVEFYAPWCPHCHDFKPTYIKLAKELTKRIIGVNIYFHAVSCTLNSDTCLTYDVDGYPTILGYRGKPEESDDEVFGNLVGNFTVRGTELDLGRNLNEDIETIATEMKFDVSSMERNFTAPESKYSNSEDQRNYELRKIERGREVAEEKIIFLEYDASMNDIYHDALLSLAYILRNGIYAQSNTKMLKEDAQKSALLDFLKLVHWATPISWEARKSFVHSLLKNFDTDVARGKERLNDFVERLTQHTQEKRTNTYQNSLPWGFIDGNSVKSNYFGKRRHELGQDIPLHLHHFQGSDPIHPKKWTKACNHGPSSSGFTCGLWELFHIISIGSGLTQNQLYGFQHGYIISQHEVAETLRNFIGNFFRCDVCRTNFINMYDGCGHEHCTRLSRHLPMAAKDGHSEVALWLWEVHNAVNVRLLQEKAQRERRNFTKTEELAAKFPTRKTCPLCWLDKDMSQWDSVEVYRFLKGHYWPYDSSSKMNIKSMHGDMAMKGQPLSKFGLGCIMLPFVVLGCIISRQFITNSRRNIFSLFQSLRKNKSFYKKM